MNTRAAGGGRRLTDRVRAGYARLAATYDSRWPGYVEETVTKTIEALEAQPGERILDVGCGTGWLLERLERRGERLELVGLDLTPEMLEVAAKRVRRQEGTDEEGGRVRLVAGDAAHLPFSDASFDAVVSSSALHHWPDPDGVFGEVERVTRPGGRVVITDWCRDVPLFWPLALGLAVLDRTIRQIYSSRDLERLMISSGLVVERTWRYRVATFWGVMTVAARKRASRHPPPGKPTRVPAR